MAEFVIFLPALLALYLMYRYSLRQSLLWVYVPCLLFVPLYLRIFIKGATFTPASPVSFVFALAGLITLGRRFRLKLIDVVVMLMSFSAFIADAHYRKLTLGLYAGSDAFFACVCPYFVGRTLVEAQGLRVRFAKSIVVCLAIVGLVSVWEFRMTANPFQSFADKLNEVPAGWGRQVRWGFARVAGPYASAITAGMVFTSGLMLQLWLFGAKVWQQAGRTLAGRRTSLLLLFALGLGLLMTQSRGPWIGCALGLIATFVGFAKNRRRAAVISVFVLTIAVSLTYVVLDNYTKVGAHGPSDGDQQNATYRRELLDTYMPVIKEGGIWGWGRPFSTEMAGVKANQPSIDNMYLLMAVGQGYFGIAVFLLIVVGTIVHLLRLCAMVRKREDAMFVFALLGTMLATAFTLTTVFLGEPMFQIFFIICGWSWSLDKSSFAIREKVLAPVTAAPAFERIFV